MRHALAANTVFYGGSRITPLYHEIEEAPKRRSGGRVIDLSPYEQMLRLYAKYQEAYGWTVREIDETDMCFLLDQLCVLERIEAGKEEAYIDDIL